MVNEQTKKMDMHYIYSSKKIELTFKSYFLLVIKVSSGLMLILLVIEIVRFPQLVH